MFLWTTNISKYTVGVKGRISYKRLISSEKTPLVAQNIMIFSVRACLSYKNLMKQIRFCRSTFRCFHQRRLNDHKIACFFKHSYLVSLLIRCRRACKCVSWRAGPSTARFQASTTTWWSGRRCAPPWRPPRPSPCPTWEHCTSPKPTRDASTASSRWEWKSCRLNCVVLRCCWWYISIQQTVVSFLIY